MVAVCKMEERDVLLTMMIIMAMTSLCGKITLEKFGKSCAWVMDHYFGIHVLLNKWPHDTIVEKRQSKI